MIGIYWASCVLLAGAGLAKAVKPHDTATALRQFGWPVPAAAVRGAGAVEVVVGLAAIVTGSTVLAMAVAVSFAAFAAWVAVALRRGLPIASCGCLGGVDSPPSLGHVALDLGAASAALWGAARGMPDLSQVLADQPAAGVPFVALVALVVWLATQVMTVLPAARRRPA